MAGCINVTGQIHGLAKLNGGSPSHHGALTPPVKGELGRELTMF